MSFSLFVVFAVKQLGATKVIPPYPQAASLKVREDQMTTQRAPVDVSFSVGEDSGTRKITMVVTTGNGENVECIGLADDMSDATEVRSADGKSFETYRGSGGYLLQSSQSGIECRVHVRNSSGAPYTVADAPDPPGFLSALIVFPSGHELEIERDTATNTYVSVTTKHLAETRRMLQHRNLRPADFSPFRCMQTRRRYLKIGVVVDKGYLFSKYRGIKADAITGIRKLWAESSVPYETQFNIKLLASKILFPDDPLLYRESWLGCGRELTDSLDGISRWRNTKQPDTFAAWYLVVGCPQTPDARGFVTLGHAWLWQLAQRRTGFLSMWENGAWRANYVGSSAVGVDDRQTTAHEIGHLFGARHTFDPPHYQQQGSRLGIMDYDIGYGIGKYFLFESMHETEMCEILTLALSEKTRITQNMQLVDYNQRWGSAPTTGITTIFQRPMKKAPLPLITPLQPTTKAPLPSTTPLQPTTETPLPSTTPLQPTTETPLPSTTPLQPTTETPLPSTTPLRPTTEAPLPAATLSPPLTATSTLGADAKKDVDSSSMLNTCVFIGIACFLVLASIGCFCYIRRKVPKVPANVNQNADSRNQQTVDSAKAKPSCHTRFHPQLEKTRKDPGRIPMRLKIYTQTKSGSNKQKSRE